MPAASVRDLRRRIRSIGNTRKITRALELVASARLRRAEARIAAMRPYAERMRELTGGTARAAASFQGLALLQQREVRNVAIVAVTSDRGLARSFHGQIRRRAFAVERDVRGQNAQVRWLVTGKKGRSTLRFRRYEIEQAWIDFTDRPTYHDAQAIAHKLEELYTEEAIDRAVVIYNRYYSPLTQTVEVQELLPISEDLLAVADDRDAAQTGDFIFEPEPEQILERLLPVYLETELFRALLESAASEHGA